MNKLQDDHGSAPLESKGNSRNIQGKHKGREPERKQVCVGGGGGLNTRWLKAVKRKKNG